MQDTGPVLVSICGLLCVAGGLLAIVIFLILKATGRTLLGAFDEIGGVAGALGIGEVTDTGDDNAPVIRQRGRRDLRARADALDFDSAVARQSAQPPAAPRPPAAAPPASTQPISPSPFDEDSLPTLRQRRTRRDRTDDADDDPDMLAGIMGEEE